MNQQDKIKERYKLISEKGAFLKICATIEGFRSCAQWVKEGVRIPLKREKEFSSLIELRLLKDDEKELIDKEFIKQIKVQNYKIISDSNFS